ncbi:hypothetical protein [Blastomonas sp.]|jgi:hypothetical protein|nr:hypothetical protein [Blastomonas sp.]
MSKARALIARPIPDAAFIAVLRFVMVSGCATALIFARYPLPL